jgi:VanZ family protein
MSAAPIPLKFIPVKRSTPVRRFWVPVACTLIFICFTSTTFMGAANSQIVVNAVWKALFGNWHANLLGEINGVVRKTGHFFGYGTVGLIFREAWWKTARAFSLVVKKWLNPFAGFLGVVSTFIVGSLDEYHQMFTPGRVGCLHDALLDTSGALVLNIVFLAIWARRQHKDGFKLPNQVVSADRFRIAACQPSS